MRKLNTLLQYYESTVKDVEQGMFFLQPIVQKELSVYSDGFEWKIWNVAISFLSNEKKRVSFHSVQYSQKGNLCSYIIHLIENPTRNPLRSN